MILETAQMLSTAHYTLDDNLIAYKPTHRNHPCNVWLRSSSRHYAWLYQLFLALVQEMEYRYGTKHSTYTKHNEALQRSPLNLKDNGWTDPPQAMPNEYKVSGDPVEAYRRYYIGDKYRFAKWSKREVPTWFDLTYWYKLTPIEYAQRIIFMLDESNMKKTSMYKQFNSTFGFTAGQIFDKITS